MSRLASHRGGLCHRHKHRSEIAAARCWAKAQQRRVDRRAARAGMPPPPLAVHHFPAIPVERGPLTVYVFSEAAPSLDEPAPRAR